MVYTDVYHLVSIDVFRLVNTGVLQTVFCNLDYLDVDKMVNIDVCILVYLEMY